MGITALIPRSLEGVCSPATTTSTAGWGVVPGIKLVLQTVVLSHKGFWGCSPGPEDGVSEELQS